MSSLRIATFHSFKVGPKPGDTKITVDWQKDLAGLGNGCRGPGYVVRETVTPDPPMPKGNSYDYGESEVIGIFYDSFWSGWHGPDGDAIKCAMTQYRTRKKEYCEFHHIPWEPPTPAR